MSTKSKAAILVEPLKPLVVDEVEFPDPAPDQVLVKLFASGICHSQLHQMHRPPDETPMMGNAPRYPTLLGHESTGVVVAKGRDVTHVKEGDHVLTTWIDRNPRADLPPRVQPSAKWRGQDVVTAASTWAEHVLSSERLIVKVDQEAPTDVTSIIGCAIMTGSGAIINTLNVRPGESVAVFGCGGIGLAAVAAAAVVDAYPIIAVDVADDKLEFARKFGATHTVNSSRGNAIEEIRALTNGGLDYAIDAIGLPITQKQIVEATRPGVTGDRRGGISLLVGIAPPGQPGMIDTAALIQGKSFLRTLAGDCRPDRDFPTFIRWLKEGKLNLGALVTRRYKLDQINEAADDLAKGRIAGRSIIVYD